MRLSPFVVVSKPVSVWQRDVKVDSKGLLKSVAKALKNGVLGKYEELIGDAGEVLTALGVSPEPRAVAWVLISRSLQRAMYDLALEPGAVPESDWAKMELPSERLDQTLDKIEIEISPQFFQRPREAAFLPLIISVFTEWLTEAGSEQARAIAGRLPGYFVYALGQEWLSAAPKYAVIQETLKHPFVGPGERELIWDRYNGYLLQQVDEGIFGEPFGLRQLYIPLRGSFVERTEKEQDGLEEKQLRGQEKGKRHLIDLETNLKAWVRSGDKADAVRLLTGGPGSGKSSFLKMLAATLSELSEESNTLRVVFLPLHQMDHTGELTTMVEKYLRNSRLLPPNILDPEQGESRLLLLFDGLDELTMQGKLGQEAAQSFVTHVLQVIGQWNTRDLRAQVIFSGRDVVIEACANSFRKPGQVLHVEPYLVEADRYQVRTTHLDDQRVAWWTRYNQLMGKSEATMPRELQGKAKLDEITAQPLLNYLVALSYQSGNRDFENLNTVYKSLLDAVYNRGYEKNKVHKSIVGLEKHEFYRVLEEIALAAWHGTGRTTTVREIREHCKQAGLEPLLEKFNDGAEKGVTRLLAAFYFRQAGGRSDEGQATYEFTHKSFGEYLTTRRILRAVERIQRERERRRDNFEEGWSEKEALKHWAEICGPTPLDNYLLEFLRGEVKTRSIGDAQKWQETLIELINHLLRHEMPMELVTPALSSFGSMHKQSRNAEEALLATTNACAICTEQTINISWPHETSARIWLESLRVEEHPLSLAFDCLSWIKVTQQSLWFMIFENGNLIEADLTGANLVGADLIGAELARANLTNANLTNANLTRANLVHADMRGANLTRTNLAEADLTDVDLTRARVWNEGVLWNEENKILSLPEALRRRLESVPKGLPTKLIEELKAHQPTEDEIDSKDDDLLLDLLDEEKE